MLENWISDLNANEIHKQKQARDRLIETGETAIGPLITLLATGTPTQVQNAVIVLGKIGDPVVVKPLAKLLHETQSAVLQYVIIRVLGDLGDRNAMLAIQPFITSSDRRVRKHSLEALVKLEQNLK